MPLGFLGSNFVWPPGVKFVDFFFLFVVQGLWCLKSEGPLYLQLHQFKTSSPNCFYNYFFVLLTTTGTTTTAAFQISIITTTIMGTFSLGGMGVLEEKHGVDAGESGSASHPAPRQ